MLDTELFRARSADHVELPAAEVAAAALTYEAWGAPLSPAGYLERERRLWRHPFSRGGLCYWELRRGGQPLASCESYAVEVALSGRGRRGDGRGVGHGIASVFVAKERRGHGYAQALLAQVHDTLRREGAWLTYLISEIGPQLYERMGYVARPLRCRRFVAPQPGEPEPGLDQVTWLAEADVPAVLARRYATLRSPLTVRLTPAQIDWHHERARIYAAALSRVEPRRLGARCGDAAILWMHNHRSDLLRVLLLDPGPAIASGAVVDPRAPELAAVRNVLHAARAEAAHAGLQGVDLWENALSTGWLRGGQSLAAEDVPMLRPLTREVDPAGWLDWERGHWL